MVWHELAPLYILLALSLILILSGDRKNNYGMLALTVCMFLLQCMLVVTKWLIFSSVFLKASWITLTKAHLLFVSSAAFNCQRIARTEVFSELFEEEEGPTSDVKSEWHRFVESA